MPNTYISFNQSFAVGGQQYQTANIPFPFLNKEDIKVTATRTLPSVLSSTIWTYVTEDYFNSTFVNGASNLSFGNYCVINENGQDKIKYKSASGNETYTITIYRRTFNSKTLQFTNGSPIQASDLNDLVLKSSYASEEAIEAVDALNNFSLNSILNNKYDKSGGTISGSSTITENLNVNGNLQVNSNVSVGGSITLPANLTGTLINVPIPAYPNDVANKAYVDSLTLNGGGQPVINNDSITHEKLRKINQEEAVTTETIRDLAVTNNKIANSTISGNKLSNSSINSQHLISGSVTTDKIANNSINTNLISNNAITTEKILDNSISTSKLQNGCVTSDKFANGSITGEKFALNFNFNGSYIQNSTLNDIKLSAPISWGASPKTTTYTSLPTTINSPVTINGAINSENSILKINSIKKLTNLDNINSYNIVNNVGSIEFENGGLAPGPGYPFNSAHLSEFNDQPLFFKALNTQLNKPNYHDYQIYIPSKAQYRAGGTTIIQFVGKLNADGYGYYQPNGFAFPFAYRTIANIPLNKMREDNQNAHISLNQQNYTITFGAIDYSATYKLTLQGSCVSQETSGSMVIAPITNYRSGNSISLEQNAPLSSLIFDFFNSRKANFSVTTLLTLGVNYPYTQGIRYYYTDTRNSLPPIAHWDPVVLNSSKYPSAWWNSWYNFRPPPNDQFALEEPNSAYVQLIIERIR